MGQPAPLRQLAPAAPLAAAHRRQPCQQPPPLRRPLRGGAAAGMAGGGSYNGQRYAPRRREERPGSSIGAALAGRAPPGSRRPAGDLLALLPGPQRGRNRRCPANRRRHREIAVVASAGAAARSHRGGNSRAWERNEQNERRGYARPGEEVEERRSGFALPTHAADRGERDEADQRAAAKRTLEPMELGAGRGSGGAHHADARATRAGGHRRVHPDRRRAHLARTRPATRAAANRADGRTRHARIAGAGHSHPGTADANGDNRALAVARSRRGDNAIRSAGPARFPDPAAELPGRPGQAGPRRTCKTWAARCWYWFGWTRLRAAACA